MQYHLMLDHIITAPDCTCVMSVWRNDITCKYMFMFPLKNLACKGLTLHWDWNSLLIAYQFIIFRFSFSGSLSQCGLLRDYGSKDEIVRLASKPFSRTRVIAWRSSKRLVAAEDVCIVSVIQDGKPSDGKWSSKTGTKQRCGELFCITDILNSGAWVEWSAFCGQM